MTAAAPGSEKTWTILELLRWTTEHFASRGIESARLDAECLLAHVLGVDRLQLYVGFEAPVGASDRAAYRELGMVGQKVALFGCTPAKVRDVVAEIEQAFLGQQQKRVKLFVNRPGIEVWIFFESAAKRLQGGLELFEHQVSVSD